MIEQKINKFEKTSAALSKPMAVGPKSTAKPKAPNCVVVKRKSSEVISAPELSQAGPPQKAKKEEPVTEKLSKAEAPAADNTATAGAMGGLAGYASSSSSEDD